MKKVLKYDELNEYSKYTSLTEDECYELTSFSSKTTGIKDVVIWIGPDSKNHIFRIKVSNIPNKISIDNCFTITIPDFKIYGDVNTELITDDKFDDIINFINLNINIIKSYSNYEICTEDLLDGLKSINNNQLKEYHKYDSISVNKVFEMSNITDKRTGIKNIVIWIGPNPKYHGYRIKVSNQPNIFRLEDSFTITIPELKVIGDINTKLITTKVFNDIIKFIELNVNLIKDFSDLSINVDELYKNLKPVK